MKINYVENIHTGKKLFSFYRHDYQEYTSPEGHYMMIDGGLGDYIRFSVDHENSFFREGEISDVIEYIREQFTWTSIMDEVGDILEEPIKRKLSTLDSVHVLNILKHIHEDPNPYKQKELYEIFHCELKYRLDVKNK